MSSTTGPQHAQLTEIKDLRRQLEQKLVRRMSAPSKTAGTSRVTFSDGEQVETAESVRGQRTFVLQSTSAPMNEHLMEMLMIMIDA
jgi:ribose-phosphate pyrophosphokinase